mmetsp:Transcript_49840/g.161274  ORF Transcript_49840/g.161274 Transcript_49840/m.161274 type:complete len:698 (-) Transcript_49840:661-2754(-)
MFDGLLAKRADDRHFLFEFDDVLAELLGDLLLLRRALEALEHLVGILELVVDKFLDAGSVELVQRPDHPVLGLALVLDGRLPEVVQRVEFLGDLLEHRVIHLLDLEEPLAARKSFHQVLGPGESGVKIVDPRLNHKRLRVVVEALRPLHFCLVLRNVFPELFLLASQSFHELDFLFFQVALAFCNSQLDLDGPLEGQEGGEHDVRVHFVEKVFDHVHLRVNLLGLRKERLRDFLLDGGHELLQVRELPLVLGRCPDLRVGGLPLREDARRPILDAGHHLLQTLIGKPVGCRGQLLDDLAALQLEQREVDSRSGEQLDLPCGFPVGGDLLGGALDVHGVQALDGLVEQIRILLELLQDLLGRIQAMHDRMLCGSLGMLQWVVGHPLAIGVGEWVEEAVPRQVAKRHLLVLARRDCVGEVGDLVQHPQQLLQHLLRVRHQSDLAILGDEREDEQGCRQTLRGRRDEALHEVHPVLASTLHEPPHLRGQDDVQLAQNPVQRRLHVLLQVVTEKVVFVGELVCDLGDDVIPPITLDPRRHFGEILLHVHGELVELEKPRVRIWLALRHLGPSLRLGATTPPAVQGLAMLDLGIETAPDQRGDRADALREGGVQVQFGNDLGHMPLRSRGLDQPQRGDGHRQEVSQDLLEVRALLNARISCAEILNMSVLDGAKLHRLDVVLLHSCHQIFDHQRRMVLVGLH